MSRTFSPFSLLSDDLASLFTEETEAKKRTSTIFHQHTCLPTHNRVFPFLLYHGHLFYCVYDLTDSSLKSCSWLSSHANLQHQLFSSVWKHFISSNHKTPSFDLSSLPTLIPFLSSHWIKTLWKSYLITLFTHFLLTTLQSGSPSLLNWIMSVLSFHLI